LLAFGNNGCRRHRRNKQDPDTHLLRSPLQMILVRGHRAREKGPEAFGKIPELKADTSGVDLTFATPQPRIRHANVKSKTPLETYIY
jgi:hypothetical protein